jgi:cytidyltransferase-like protein
MDIIDLSEKKPYFPDGLALCLGTFDGLHQGHQRLIIEASLSGEGEVGVLLFDQNPANFLSNGKEKAVLTSLEDQIALLKKLRVDVVLLAKVDPAFFNLTPEEFIAQYLKPLHVNLVVVGEDFRFGKDALGTPKTLAKDFPVLTVPLLEENGIKISTSAIKLDLKEGRIEDASLFVGVELLAFGGAVKNPFPHPDRVRGDFDEFIEVDVVEASFKRHLARGFEDDHELTGGRADVGHRLRHRAVDREVDRIAVLADDHAFIADIARDDEHRAVLFDFLQGRSWWLRPCRSRQGRRYCVRRLRGYTSDDIL